MGVVVRRYIDILIIIITFPYCTCNSSCFGSSIPNSCSFLNVFSFFIIKNIYIWLTHIYKNVTREESTGLLYQYHTAGNNTVHKNLNQKLSMQQKCKLPP